jgi:hypothetical protein
VSGEVKPCYPDWGLIQLQGSCTGHGGALGGTQQHQHQSQWKNGAAVSCLSSTAPGLEGEEYRIRGKEGATLLSRDLLVTWLDRVFCPGVEAVGPEPLKPLRPLSLTDHMEKGIPARKSKETREVPRLESTSLSGLGKLEPNPIVTLSPGLQACQPPRD